ARAPAPRAPAPLSRPLQCAYSSPPGPAPAGRPPTVGFAQVYRAFSSLSMDTAWILNDLYVAPEGRRTGAGRALLREVLRRAREAGVTGVQLETAYDNTVAQGLYEAEGFVREEFHVYFHELG
ncbi:GNAT family N-acetyltransferase, partial [Streptomyces sp. NPDC059385]|uniref:GNAT family N-acetyltransferase n=1 Tax=Streptomyces sp. NPDC059385 TaxID=3346817 RepID=UPI0036CC59E2